ncbi:hypothetical protein [uncultured Dysosmobacter sp.]|uniref:hypothetical protein n=1 Tax=uncultured Dysosmobacter sp. TaxID=2591384 RepID=UPI002615DE57|nr:hypothetical protein [uncultured Dysosmobacter sp.]
MSYFEIHFACYETKEAQISGERILKEMPDIALTDADLALEETLLSAPEVIEAMKSGESMSLPDFLTEQLANGYLPENAELFDVSVSLNTVYFDYFETPEKRVMLAFFQDETYGQQKTIGLYKVKGDGVVCKAVYENENGDLKKYTESRHLFAYSRDRLWEE